MSPHSKKLNQSINVYLYSAKPHPKKSQSALYNHRKITNWAPRAHKVRHWPGKTPLGKKPRADPEGSTPVDNDWVIIQSMTLLSHGHTSFQSLVGIRSNRLVVDFSVEIKKLRPSPTVKAKHVG